MTPSGFSHPVFLGKYVDLQLFYYPKYVALRKIFTALLRYSWICMFQIIDVCKKCESDL